MSLNLPDQLDLDVSRHTVGELALKLYPGIACDTALPQDWLNAALNRGQDVRGHVVWAYPKGHLFGYPLPITEEGAHMLGRLATNIG